MSVNEVTKYNVDLHITCPMCLEFCEEDRDSLVRARCGHLFHENCFIPWRMIPKSDGCQRQEKTCPLCRGSLADAQYIKPDTNAQVDHVHSTVAPYIVVPGAVPSVPVPMPVPEPDFPVDVLAEEDAVLIQLNTEEQDDAPEQVNEPEQAVARRAPHEEEENGFLEQVEDIMQIGMGIFTVMLFGPRIG